MSNFSSLKAAIQQYIKTNGNEEITGAVLQDILLSMVSVLGDTAINDLETALQTETTNRTNADGTLQQNITAEGNARQQADTALGGRIDGLQTAINGINTKLAEGYIYAGIATTSTNPGTPTGKVFYIATASGTYTNFSGIELTYGINILKYNGSAWSSEQAIAIDDVPTAESNNLVKSGGVFSAINEGLCNSIISIRRKGAGSTLNDFRIKLAEGRIYKISVPRWWDMTGISNVEKVFTLYRSINGSDTQLFGFFPNTIPNAPFEYVFKAQQNDYYIEGYRGTADVNIDWSIIDVTDEIQKLRADDFVGGSINSDGSIDVQSLDTIMSRGYYDLSNKGLSVLSIVLSQKDSYTLKYRISFYNANFAHISTSSWGTSEQVTIPANARYYRLGIRAYDGADVAYSNSNPMPVDYAEYVISNISEIEKMELENVSMTSGRITYLISSEKPVEVIIESKTASNPTIGVKYFDGSSLKVFLSNSNFSSNKKDLFRLVLPPTLFSAQTIVLNIEGSLEIQNLAVKEISITQSSIGINMIGHLGYRLWCPENTIASYKMAAVCGFDGCVCNVLPTSDGGLICYHQDDERLTLDGGQTIVALSGAEVAAKTTAEMTAYNAGLYMSQYWADENVPEFWQYCVICTKNSMRPVLSLNYNESGFMEKIKSVLDKYNLTDKTIIRSYDKTILSDAFSVFGNNFSYLLDMETYNQGNVDWFAANFGTAEKIVGINLEAEATQNNIDYVLGLGMLVNTDPTDSLASFNGFVNNGVTFFTGHTFIKPVL